LLLIAIPVLANVQAIPEELHIYIVILTVPLSLTVLSYGSCQHKSFIPLAAGIAGLLSMIAALNVEYPNNEIILSCIGSLVLAFAHINNWKRRLQCTVSGRS